MHLANVNITYHMHIVCLWIMIHVYIWIYKLNLTISLTMQKMLQVRGHHDVHLKLYINYVYKYLYYYNVSGQLIVFDNSFQTLQSGQTTHSFSYIICFLAFFIGRILIFFFRTIANKLSIFRFRNSVARYQMLKHRRTPVNTARYFIYC